MLAAHSMCELLERSEARPSRYGRRWWCPRCEGKTPALAVDLEREVFFCHRCRWKGGRRTLARELGIETDKANPAEQRKALLICGEAERFAEWARRKRIGTAALLRELDGYEIRWREIGRKQLAAGEPVSELVWGKMQAITAWQQEAEARWQRLCEFDQNAPELYEEFVDRRQAA